MQQVSHKKISVYPGKARTLLNIASLIARRLSAIIVAVITAPLIIKHFDLKTYGAWVLITQYAAHLQLFELGLSGAVTRCLSASLAKGDEDEANRVIATTITVLLVISALIVLTLFPQVMIFLNLYNFPLDTSTDVAWLISFTIFSVAALLPLRVGAGMLGAAHRFDRVALWEGIEPVLKLLGILFIFNYTQYSLFSFGVTIFFSALICKVLMYADAKCYFRYLGNFSFGIDGNIIKTIFSLSFSGLVISASAVFLRQGLPMAAGYLLGVKSVALIAIPMLITTALMPFFSIASRLIQPVASAATATGAEDKMEHLYVLTSKYLMALAGLLLVFLYYFTKLLLIIWLGKSGVSREEINIMTQLFLIIFSGFCVSCFGYAARGILVSVGLHWSSAYKEILGVALSFCVAGLGFCLGYGIYAFAFGIAFSFVIRAVFMHLLISDWFSRPALTMFLEIALVPILLSLLSYEIFNSLLALKLFDEPLFQLSFDFVVLLFFWCCAAYSVLLDRAHKDKLKAVVNGV